MTLKADLEKLRGAVEPDLGALSSVFKAAGAAEVLETCSRDPARFRMALVGCSGSKGLERLRFDLVKTALAGSRGGSATVSELAEGLVSNLGAFSSRHLAGLAQVCAAAIFGDRDKDRDVDDVLGDQVRSPAAALGPVLSKLLTLIGERRQVPVDTDDDDDDGDDGDSVEDGREFRKKFVRKLCQERWWPKGDVPRLVSLFKDIESLAAPEVDVVVEKACSVLSSLFKSHSASMADHAPPLVYQILMLTSGSANSAISGTSLSGSSASGPGSSDSAQTSVTLTRLVRSLAKVFNPVHLSLINKASSTSAEDTDSVDIEGPGSDAYLEVMQSTEGTIMYHLVHAVRMGHPIAKEVLKLARSCSQLPEILLRMPFVHFLILAMSSDKHQRTPCIEHLKSAISKAIQIQVRQEENAWFRNTIPATSSDDLSGTIDQLVVQTSRHGGWELVSQGLVELGTSLLDFASAASATGVAIASGSQGTKAARQRFYQKVWQLGIDVALSLVKCHNRPEAVKSILVKLVQRIVFSNGQIQYVECLGRVVKEGLSTIVNETELQLPGVLRDLLEQLGTLNAGAARRVLTALMPLIREDRRSSIRDSVVLVLRKSLFSPATDVRKVAVGGVLQLLKQFRIASGSSLPVTQMLLTQSSSGLSQALIDIHRGVSTTNEALCLELLEVLRRCLSSQGPVRKTVYQGLGEVVGRNPELCMPILDLLHQHVVELGLQVSGDPAGAGGSINPIDVDSYISDSKEGPILMEPIGWFLHCVQLLVSKGQQLYGSNVTGDESDEDVDTTSLDRLVSLLDRLAVSYSRADLIDMNLERNSDYSTSSSVGKANVMKVNCYKNVFEALMEYTITHGVELSEEKATLLCQLHHGHRELDYLTKSGTTGGKSGKQDKRGGRPKKKAAKVDGSIVKKGSPTAAKRSAAAAVSHPADHAISLKALSVILQAVLNDQVPAHQSALALVRAQRELVTFFLDIAMAKIAQVDRAMAASGTCNESAAIVLRHLSSIASTLIESVFYNAGISNSHTMASSIDCISNILKVVASHFLNDKPKFFEAVGKRIGELVERQENGNEERTGRKVVPALLEKLMEKMTVLKEKVGQDDEEEAQIRANLSGCFRLALQLIRDPDASSKIGVQRQPASTKLYEWVKDYAANSQETRPDSLKPVLDLLLTCTAMVKPISTITLELARDIHAKIGDLEVSAEESRLGSSYGFITAESAEAVFQQMFLHLESSLDCAEVVVNRCRQVVLNRDQGTISVGPPDAGTDNLSECETNLCHLIGHIVNATGELVLSGFRLGPALDNVVKLLIKLYSTVGLLVRYFFARCRHVKEAVRISRLDMLVPLIGKTLTKNVYSLITNIQEQQSEAAGKVRKQSVKSRAMKDIKTIPNLVFKIEAFEKDVIKLSKRCNVDLTADCLKVSTARDFRLMTDRLAGEEDPEIGEDEEGQDEDSEDGINEKENRDGPQNSLQRPHPPTAKGSQRLAEGGSRLDTTTSSSAVSSPESRNDSRISVMDQAPAKRLKRMVAAPKTVK